MQVDLTYSPAYCPPPAFALTAQKETAAQAAGRRYEDKTILFLTRWCLGNRYEPVAKPWIAYTDVFGHRRYCQPDFLAFSQDTDNLLVIEIKLRHTREAFKQLRHYRDLISVLHPTYSLSCLEICRYFDSSEYKVELLPAVRPHNLPFAAVTFEPKEWTQAIN